MHRVQTPALATHPPHVVCIATSRLHSKGGLEAQKRDSRIERKPLLHHTRLPYDRSPPLHDPSPLYITLAPSTCPRSGRQTFWIGCRSIDGRGGDWTRVVGGCKNCKDSVCDAWRSLSTTSSKQASRHLTRVSRMELHAFSYGSELGQRGVVDGCNEELDNGR